MEQSWIEYKQEIESLIDGYTVIELSQAGF